MRTRVRFSAARRTAAVAGVLAAGTLAGCASGSTSAAAPPTAKQAILLAAETAAKVNSIAATLEVQAKTSATGTAESVTVGGTFQAQVHPSLTVEADFSTFEAAGTSLPGGVTEILTSNEVYAKIPELMTTLASDKEWIGLPLTTLSAGTGVDFTSLFDQLSTSSPLAQTQLLAGSKNVTKVGTGTVNGVAVTEYTGSYTMSAALASLPASVRSSFSTEINQADLGNATCSFTVWIDSSNNVRKEIVTVNGAALSETVTFTVTSINQPVSITVPPASEVYTLSASQLSADAP